MSHVSKIELKVKDLASLKRACKNLGLDFKENQKKFKWYGHHVGDYPLPQGFKKEDMGKCDHAISVKNNPKAYEVGVCKSRDGSGGYELLWDFWQNGYGLKDAIGDEGRELQEEYAACVSEKSLRDQGYIVTRTKSGQKVGA